MKATDLVAELLYRGGARRAYGLQGGAVVHIFDSLEQSGKVACHYLHHEQSAALAAVADAKFSKDLGLVVVTTGPGGTNALTGLLAAWQDSVPVVFLSGQVRLDQTSYGRPVRQIGSQEFAIVEAVRCMTKFATVVKSVSEIEPVFTEALRVAKEGRPGPVWIDFPLDLQWLQAAPPADAPSESPPLLSIQETAELDLVLDELRQARAPLVLAGHGVHLSSTEGQLRAWVERHRIPIVSTWAGSDLLPTCHPLNGGVIGLSGQRGANRLVFESDYLLVLGANLSPTQVGSARTPYAPQARKTVITFDKNQLAASTVKVDRHLALDLGLALNHFTQHSQAWSAPDSWQGRCAQAGRENRVGSVNLDRLDPLPSGMMSTNVAIAQISAALCNTHHLIVDGGGTALYGGFQSATRGPGKRLICSTGISAMGTGLAETVGVSLASGKSPTLTFIGDGSFLMNIQDLASIAQHKLPAVIAIVNNAGYLAIKHTQRDYLGKRYFGTDSSHGLPMPDFKGIVEGFGLRYTKATDYNTVAKAALEAKSLGQPWVVDLIVDPDQDTLFRQAVVFRADGTSAPSDLSEMWPFSR